MFDSVMTRGHRRLAMMALIMTLAVGCDDDSPTGSSLDEQIDQVRRVTDRFQSADAARAAGHSVLVTHPVSGARCIADSTAGGMGLHLLDPSLADDSVDVEEPEALIYEPLAGGELRLVAVEYLIPFAVRPDTAPPPELFGKPFMANQTFGVWALHAWAWKDNPSGAFADFNPNVSCEHEPEVP